MEFPDWSGLVLSAVILCGFPHAFCFPGAQVLRLITQLSFHKDNTENILVAGTLQAVHAIVNGVLEDGPRSMIRCRDAMMSCITVVRQVAQSGPVRRLFLN